MATRSDSAHARSTDPHRAATCTCDKQTVCVLGLCAARHIFLCVMRLQLAFDFGLQLSHGCAPTSKNGFSATIFLNASSPCLMNSHCTPCSLTVVMSIFSSRPRYPSLATFVSQTLFVRFRLDVFPIANEHSSVRRLSPPLVGVTLHFHLHPNARHPLNLLFGHLRLVSWTVDFRGP